ncbi:MAG: cytochrome c family protein [Gemmataceae bacterium]|nr:cytochrome c family protein [Gemmataceae bacterium]
MRTAILRWGLGVAVLSLGLTWGLGTRTGTGQAGTPAPKGKQADSAVPGGIQLTGTASCSGRGCHGSLKPTLDRKPDDPVQLDEYTRWLLHDKHANAHAVLFNKRSQRMAELLNIPKDKAHEEPRCLACHSNPFASGPAAVAELRRTPPTARAEVVRAERVSGVGCESCHGSAEKWLAPHTSAAWKKLSAEEKFKQGMVPVSNLAVLAETCAGCHVGAPPGAAGIARDVNHDLIAAGHPRLNFEFGAYLANLPPHWNTKVRKRSADEEARAWAVGQAVSACAALDLLAHRADEAARDPRGHQPWPEFSEYDCFACHHNLPASWRWSKQHYSGRKPGAFPWGTWYFALPPRLDSDKQGELTPSLDALEKLMSRPSPPAQEVARQARTAFEQMRNLQQRVGAEFDQAQLRRLLGGLGQNGGKGLDALTTTWDGAEQLYLAAHALGELPPDAAVHKARAFAPGEDSPRLFRPDLFHKSILPWLKGLEKTPAR